MIRINQQFPAFFIFSQLVQQLMREGKKDKAKAALDYAEKMIPAYNVPYDWQNGAVQMAEAYYQLGETGQGGRDDESPC